MAPDKPRRVGMPKTNTTHMTNQQREKLYPKKLPKSQSPTAKVPVFKPYQPAQPAQFKPFKPAQPAKIERR